ncbi:MAG: hypothetical protein R2873_25610 [Caldilineaceae bacterium]
MIACSTSRSAAAAYFNAHRQALLVLDNVEDPAALLRPLADEAYCPRCRCGCSLPRRRHLRPFAPVEVTVLPEEAALRLLTQPPRTGVFARSQNPEYAEAR